MRLFHLSDDPAIVRFEPRRSQTVDASLVWAVDADHMANYLLPRDCPRVCFRAAPSSTPQDIKSLLGSDRAVVAIEAGWLDRVAAAHLYCYQMPVERFTELDANAGYWISRDPVVPTASEVLSDLPGELARRATALRVLPSLWPLHAAIAASSLAFSMIRMRHAAPPVQPAVPVALRTCGSA